MQKIKWGIIGCGNVTEVKSGPAFNKVPDSELVAVMRRNAGKAEDYARRHQVRKWFSNADELIHDPEVNAIYIATPPLYHEAYTIQALKAGKPVYVEKPMALTASEAQQMVDVSNANGAKLCVAHYRRRWPLFLKVKSLLKENVLGKIQIVTLRLLQPQESTITVKTEDNWRINQDVSGGGLFHDLAPHQLDLLYYFFGKSSRISGISFNQGGYYAADDTVSGQMLFEDQILFQGLWSFAAPKKEALDQCEIVGEKGKMRFSFFSDSTLLLLTDNGEEVISFGRLTHVQQPMIEKVVSYFLGRDENPCPGEEGVEVMKMMDALTTAI